MEVNSNNPILLICWDTSLDIHDALGKQATWLASMFTLQILLANCLSVDIERVCKVWPTRSGLLLALISIHKYYNLTLFSFIPPLREINEGNKMRGKQENIVKLTFYLKYIHIKKEFVFFPVFSLGCIYY